MPLCRLALTLLLLYIGNLHAGVISKAAEFEKLHVATEQLRAERSFFREQSPPCELLAEIRLRENLPSTIFQDSDIVRGHGIRIAMLITGIALQERFFRAQEILSQLDIDLVYRTASEIMVSLLPQISFRLEKKAEPLLVVLTALLKSRPQIANEMNEVNLGRLVAIQELYREENLPNILSMNEIHLRCHREDVEYILKNEVSLRKQIIKGSDTFEIRLAKERAAVATFEARIDSDRKVLGDYLKAGASGPSAWKQAFAQAIEQAPLPDGFASRVEVFKAGSWARDELNGCCHGGCGHCPFMARITSPELFEKVAPLEESRLAYYKIYAELYRSMGIHIRPAWSPALCNLPAL